MSDLPHDDPAEELRQLAGGLAAHLSRAARRGRRRLPESERLGATRLATPTAQDPARPATASSPESARSADEAPSSLPTAPAADPRKELESAVSGPKSGVSTTPPEGADERIRRLAAASADLTVLRAEVAACEACDLCRTRTQTVFSDGSEGARVMFVGEAPGFHEDRQGVPFVGDAGQLLSDIITKGMKLARQDVYITNILKCRPPENRDPAPLEKALCTGWLERQIELVDPEVLIPLGRHAAGHILGLDETMGRMRGKVHTVGGRKVVPTYHPAYLLRTPSAKKACWEDIQLAMVELGLPIS